MQIIVQTFLAQGEKSGSHVRVRPLPNQSFNTDMRVECSRKMRIAFPVGQLFCLNVKVVRRLNSPDFLYSNYRDRWKLVTKIEAEEFIKKNFSL